MPKISRIKLRNRSAAAVTASTVKGGKLPPLLDANADQGVPITPKSPSVNSSLQDALSSANATSDSASKHRSDDVSKAIQETNEIHYNSSVKSKVADGKTVSSNSDAAKTIGRTKAKKQEQKKKQQESEKIVPLSRGQRKRQAKREQYMKRERMVLNSLQLKREDEQKKRIDGLDAIKEALLATVRANDEKNEENEDEPASKAIIKSNRARRELVGKETAQLNLVLQHPQFQADPFAAIREHLQNSTAKDAQKNAKEAVKHAKERAEKMEKKKAVKKEQGIKKKSKSKFRATRSKSR